MYQYLANSNFPPTHPVDQLLHDSQGTAFTSATDRQGERKAATLPPPRDRIFYDDVINQVRNNGNTPCIVEGMEPENVRMMVAKRNLLFAAPDFQISMLVNFRGVNLINYHSTMNIQ